MTKFETMTSEVAATVASRLSKGDAKRAERFARSNAFDIASNFSDYTEEDAYEAIMAKAYKLAK